MYEMTIFKTRRWRDNLIRGNSPKQEPTSAGCIDELDPATEQVLRSVAECEARLAEMAARQARHINRATLIFLVAIALAVAIVLRFG